MSDVNETARKVAGQLPLDEISVRQLRVDANAPPVRIVDWPSGFACWIRDDEQDARKLAIDAFRQWVAAPPRATFRARAALALRGKNLACWCAEGAPCHADVLLDLANGASP